MWPKLPEKRDGISREEQLRKEEKRGTVLSGVQRAAQGRGGSGSHRCTVHHVTTVHEGNEFARIEQPNNFLFLSSEMEPSFMQHPPYNPPNHCCITPPLPPNIIVTFIFFFLFRTLLFFFLSFLTQVKISFTAQKNGTYLQTVLQDR